MTEKMRVEIQDFEDKKTQAGQRYTRFKTSNGWMSCFNQKASEELKKWEGKGLVSIEVKTAGKFTNIENVLGEADTQDEDQAEVEVIKPGDKPSTHRVDRAKALELALQYPIEGQDFKTTANNYFCYITEGN